MVVGVDTHVGVKYVPVPFISLIDDGFVPVCRSSANH